jgi:hypothetical protein
MIEVGGGADGIDDVNVRVVFLCDYYENLSPSKVLIMVTEFMT